MRGLNNQGERLYREIPMLPWRRPGAVKDLVALVRVYLRDEKYYVFADFHLPEDAAKDPSKRTI